MATDRQNILSELKDKKIKSLVKSAKKEIHIKNDKDFTECLKIAKKYGYSTVYGFIN